MACVSEPNDINVESGNGAVVCSEGEIFVKFTPEVSNILADMGLVRSSLTRSGVPSVDEVLDIVGGAELTRVFPVDPRHEERTKLSGLDRWYRVRFKGNYSVEEVCRRFSALGEVQKVDVNRTVKRANSRKAIPLSQQAYDKMCNAATRSGSVTFDDPLLSKQWNLINTGDMFVKDGVVKSVKGADVQVEEAWTLAQGDASVVVAVLDEGVWVRHPDLEANIWVNSDESADLTKDLDNNGYDGDINGYNFVHETGRITWSDYYDSGHGSHVAGTIAAVNNNGEGISSIAGGNGTANSGVKIMVCQIFSGNLSTGIWNVVRAIKYAADNGAVVLQCSWGYVSGAANAYDWGAAGFASEEEWKLGSPLEKEALDYFTHNAGSPNGVIDGGIAVYAAGNEAAPMAGYPGAAADYVSVAATAADFTPASYTNYGPGTTISAPGGDQDYYYEYYNEEFKAYGAEGCILSTVPTHISESGYAYFEGTSMATPQVSAVVALGLSYATKLRRHFKAVELQQLLHDTATPIDEYMTGYKTYSRYVADIGVIQPVRMSLAPYRGQMGTGQVNTAALLRAIEGKGVEMRFPNMMLKVGASAAVAPSLYFVGGEGLSYEVSIADTAIATAEQKDGKIIFTGKKIGTTTGSVTASNGVRHSFNITVSSSAMPL